MVYPSVAVVMATRNRPLMAERALASISRQTFQDFRICVVDDGSSEENAEAYRLVASRFGDRCRLVQPLRAGESGSGPSATRNRGISAAQDPYVAFLDDDDTWTWDRHLETAVAALEDSRGDLYIADMQGYRGDSLVIDSWFRHGRAFEGERVRETPPVFRSTRASILDAAGGRAIHPNMLVVRRQLLERSGLFLTTLWFAEDLEFVLRLLDNTSAILHCPQVMARYRLPEGNSLSSATTRTVQDLQTLAAAQHLGMSAKTVEIRQEARKLESWTLRDLSQQMKGQGRRRDALRLSLQALVVRPSLGAIFQVAKTVVS